ncbi:alpha/beta hydrolase [Gillisia sp. M10.2A]|uniref:Alpha/beta hydrolase n=1 Tax=Gillisia lutea TaxID=2909668 RepID=A0ABS9EDY9_9FLAO|nr:alpha/beta hydrolase [Gillisia lutea]MCF4100993.1 alpha/beta hydrolase [Gillisia lutea]
MKKALYFSFLFLFSYLNYAQETTYTETELSINEMIDGTLVIPNTTIAPNLVIFIQGSGPTDRNGNQMMMKNDGIKKIAHQLGEHGIASYRFDKRIFKMNKFRIKEEDLRFEDFVTDVNSILEYFNANDQFAKLILAGHSEGSLIGMLAAAQGAEAFISLAGAGESIDKIIVAQIAKQSKELSENAAQAFKEIDSTGKSVNYNPLLASIFRPSVQPYMKSWMKYDPAIEIKKLDIPVLIINGTADIQVEVKDAQLLKAAKPEAQLDIIENMNHIFRNVGEDLLQNTKTYNEAHRPLHEDLIPVLTNFIQSLE